MNDNSILIDQYLQNEMSEEERLAFENQLAADKILKEEFMIQQQIIKAAETAGLKNEFARAIKKRILTRRLIQWGIAIAIVATGFLFYAIKSDLFSGHKELAGTENIKAVEKFAINNSSDTIIETKDGVVFAIPAHAFNSSGNIQLEIKTALNAYDIMQQGLSTMSNDALLQTAGMFYINGFEDGKPIALVKEIAVSVPASNINPAMQLFDGVEDSNGHINWVNPKPAENKLRTYDISTLDFYPPNYIPVLKALQKNYQDKKYTDSLYYSFSGYPHTMPAQKDPAPVIENIMSDKDYKKADTAGKRLMSDSLKAEELDANYTTSYEIDPARIRTIWNKKFNNTIIATKEFEERLRYIHSLCWAESFLSIYLHNLDKPLYESDKLCAKNHSDEISEGVNRKFLEFAARKDGSVIIAAGMQQKLSTYFQQKYSAYKEAAAKTWAKYEAELTQLNNIADAKRRAESLNTFTRENKNFQEELCINLTDAYRQIGVKRSCNDTIVPPSAKYYNVTISTTGWKNLDVYVLDATANRQSMTYTDPITGKMATLTYSEVNIKIENFEQYDRVLVYLIPDSLSSFQRIEQQGDSFKEKLNSLFRYDAVALAYKGEQVFFYRQQSLEPANYVFRLSPITDGALHIILKGYSLTKNAELHAEFEYQLFEQQESIRQLQLRKDQEFREQVASYIFSCVEGAGPMTLPATPK